MFAPRLSPGDTIGIIYPSQILDETKHARIADVLGRLGFTVAVGPNASKDTDGYLASAQERADDLNAMVADDTVKMVLFGGGEGAVELLPLIDYDAIITHPTLFSSFSDATSILNAIRSRTGLVTYYGAGVNQFRDLRYYDYLQFQSHFMTGHHADRFTPDGPWVTLNGGRASGELIGGFDELFALMLANPYFSYDTSRDYLLFIEDHEYFNEVGAVNTYLSFIEQSRFMATVTGVIFGHYAEQTPEDLLGRLRRLGQANGIPVVYTDDFGHGTKHGILPIGVEATLDADRAELWFHSAE